MAEINHNLTDCEMAYADFEVLFLIPSKPIHPVGLWFLLSMTLVPEGSAEFSAPERSSPFLASLFHA